MESRNNNSTNKNKGHTIYIGDTLVGFINIWEKNVPVNTVLSLQDPENMKAILAKAELRPYADKPMVDTADVDAIIAESQTTRATEEIVADAESGDQEGDQTAFETTDEADAEGAETKEAAAS